MVNCEIVFPLQFYRLRKYCARNSLNLLFNLNFRLFFFRSYTSFNLARDSLRGQSSVLSSKWASSPFTRNFRSFLGRRVNGSEHICFGPPPQFAACRAPRSRPPGNSTPYCYIQSLTSFRTSLFFSLVCLLCMN